jgi:hypothetical protein
VIVIEIPQVWQRLEHHGGSGRRDGCVCYDEASQILTQATAIFCDAQLY